MAEALSTAEIDHKAGIPAEDLRAAVDAVLEATACSSKAHLYMLGHGYRLDVTTAIRAYEPAVKALADSYASERVRRATVREALVLAGPKKP